MGEMRWRRWPGLWEQATLQNLKGESQQAVMRSEASRSRQDGWQEAMLMSMALQSRLGGWSFAELTLVSSFPKPKGLSCWDQCR
jgi:hypothetical protein